VIPPSYWSFEVSKTAPICLIITTATPQVYNTRGRKYFWRWVFDPGDPGKYFYAFFVLIALTLHSLRRYHVSRMGAFVIQSRPEGTFSHASTNRPYKSGMVSIP
jgi:hypothetical protein